LIIRTWTNIIRAKSKIPKEDINSGVSYNKQSTCSDGSVSGAYWWNT